MGKKVKGDKWDPDHCAVCTPPLMPENEDAVRIFMIVQNQFIMSGMGGPVAIDQVAIHEAMRLYQIRDRRRCFEQVLELASWRIGELTDEQNREHLR